MATDNVIGGYRLLNMMMQGQTSQVWEVTEASSHRHFALKLLLPENTRSPEHLRFLTHEASIGMQLRHTNVIRIIKLVRERNNPYIIMEFFPGKNLGVRIRGKEPLVRERAHWILEQAAAGLAHFNDKGWVHRDVKPDNILINASAEVRLIDFALAQRVNKGSGLFRWLRRKRLTMGTRSYMSPEQIKNKPLDARADVYSFGATMYQLVTNRLPFVGASPAELLTKHLVEKAAAPKVHNPEVTDECSDLIMRMLSKEKKERPKDFFEFMAAFRTMRVFKSDKLETPAR